jgi:photosystem II stability/assembly factor-like uncharacterized protein
MTTSGSTVVMVTGKGEIASSFDDGFTWRRTALIREVDEPLRLVSFIDVATGDGNWVACSFGQEIAISDDAQTWETVLFPPPFRPRYLDFFAGEFFGIATSGRVYRSSDGREWMANEERVFETGTVNGFAVGSGRLVVSSQTAVYSSADGLVWEEETLPDLEGFTISDLAFVADRFVAFGDNLLLTSADGQSWQRSALSEELDFDFRYVMEDPVGTIALDAFREVHHFDQAGVYLDTKEDTPLLSLAQRTTGGSLVGGMPSPICGIVRRGKRRGSPGRIK